MPKFYRSTTKKPVIQTRRTFVGKSLSKPHSASRRFVKVSDELDEQKTQVLPKEKKTLHTQAASTIDSLNELLSRKTKAEQQQNGSVVEENNAVFNDETEVDAFNGISDLDEQEQLYDTAIDYHRKKSKAVEEQIKLIEAERDMERRKMEAEIKELKRELHRTAPLHDTKFFSLSKELKEAISEIEQVAGPLPKTISGSDTVKELPVAAEAFSQPGMPPLPVVSEPKVVVKPTVPDTAVVGVNVPTNQDAPSEQPKKLPKKKILITGASAIALFIVVSNLVAGNIGKQTKVDQKIVEAYLPSQNGQVQGAQTAVGAASPQNQANDSSQADISFEQCVWEEFNDPSFGVMLQFPKNAVKAIRTDSNITFVRKTGYLFKIQRIETSLSLDDYWKQIKPTSLNFAVVSDTFKGKPSLKLSLEDLTDYPGDRIMVKEGGFIYDVWYATPSNSFTQDDMQRVEKMLASLSIVGAK